MPPSPLPPTASSSANERPFPPQPPRSARSLPFPSVQDPEAPPLRPERHVPNSIATVRKHEDGTVTHDGPKGLRFLPQPMDRARRLLRESVKYLDRDFHPEKTDDFEKRVRAFLKEQL